MEVLGIYKFGVDSVAGASRSELGAFGGVLGVGVAGLYHEFIYYAVKEYSVVEAFVGEFHEIVAMLGGVAVEAHLYVAHRSGDVDDYVG